MAHVGSVNRWDVFWADLEPGVGHEQKGPPRPVVVVSNDGFNGAGFRMVTVVPATKAEGTRRAAYTFEVLLPKGTVTSEHASIVMPHQIRSISTMRLLERIGVVSIVEYQREIENRILEHLGIVFEAEEIE